MADGNDKIKHNWWPYLYFTYFFWTQLKIEWYLDPYMTFIFLDERTGETCWEMSVFILGWDIKYCTLLDIFECRFFLFRFYIIWVCWVRICRITFYLWCQSPLNKQNLKWPRKLHIFYQCVAHLRSIFGFCMIWSWFNLSVMFFR